MSDTVDLAVGARYGLRTFKPRIVRGLPHLTSVSQDPIPNLDPSINVPSKFREMMVGTHPVAWEDGTCEATCQRRYNRDKLEDHDPPDRKCGCGVYALDDLKDLYAQYPRECEQVAVVIAASGRTIECNKGIRTRYARVVAYWVLNHPDKCDCRVCIKYTKVHPYLGRYRAWNDPTREGFPYLMCAMAQFQNAQRWREPDEMAKHYGLKATPIVFGNPHLPVPGPRQQLTLPIPGQLGSFSVEIPIR